MRDQALALRQQLALVEEAGADARLHGLDERTVLQPDLVVEGEQLLDRRFWDVLGEEVVQDPRVRSGASGTTGPAARFGGTGSAYSFVTGQSQWNWPSTWPSPRFVGPNWQVHAW